MPQKDSYQDYCNRVDFWQPVPSQKDFSSVIKALKFLFYFKR